MVMKKVLLLASLAVFGLSPLVHAVENDDFQKNMILADATQQDYKDAKQKYKNMTPAQRKAFKADVKKKWDSLSAEDKQAFKTKVKDKAEVLKQQKKKKSADDTVYIRIFGYEELSK